MSNRDVHVVKSPSRDGWDAKQDGNVIGHGNTQKAAENVGRYFAQMSGSDLVTHGLDGKIRSKDSFGNDPRSIKDREH